MQEVLQLQDVIPAWRDRGFDVIFVTLSSPDAIRRFREARDVDHMATYQDPGGAMHEAYSVRAVPTTFILDTEGVIREITLGWSSGSLDQLQSWVDRLAPES